MLSEVVAANEDATGVGIGKCLQNWENMHFVISQGLAEPKVPQEAAPQKALTLFDDDGGDDANNGDGNGPNP